MRKCSKFQMGCKLAEYKDTDSELRLDLLLSFGPFHFNSCFVWLGLKRVQPQPTRLYQKIEKKGI